MANFSDTRVISFRINDSFDKERSPFGGICFDLWERTANDLNLTYTVKIAESRSDALMKIKSDEADIIVERMDGDLLEKDDASTQGEIRSTNQSCVRSVVSGPDSEAPGPDSEA